MKHRIALVVAVAAGAMFLNGCVVVGTTGNDGNGGAGGMFLFFVPLFLFVLIARLVRSGRRRRIDFGRDDPSNTFDADIGPDGRPDAFGRETPRGDASDPRAGR